MFFPDDIQLTREKQKGLQTEEDFFCMKSERSDCSPNKLWKYINNLLCEKEGSKKGLYNVTANSRADISGGTQPCSHKQLKVQKRVFIISTTLILAYIK